jgi:membrane associated rhomboid family serine protease
MPFLQDTPRITKNLIIINIIVFLATWLNRPMMITCFALFHPSSELFRWWQPVTHLFMHGGFWHLFFNMYTLYIFGCVVERIIGERKFLLLYFICGLGAAACHLGVESVQLMRGVPTVGASGAIYGVLIAYAMLFPDSRLTLLFPPVTLKARTMVLIFIGIELLTGVTGTGAGIAHFAHLGGALFGFLLIRYWRWRGTLFDREDLYRRNDRSDNYMR